MDDFYRYVVKTAKGGFSILKEWQEEQLKNQHIVTNKKQNKPEYWTGGFSILQDWQKNQRALQKKLKSSVVQKFLKSQS